MSSNQPVSGEKIPGQSTQGAILDFLLPIVEFLGILVPGLVFFALSIPSLAVPIIATLEFIRSGRAPQFHAFDLFIEILKNSTWALTTLILVGSYVAGHIFYRRDPKIPDERSFQRVPLKIRQNGPVRICAEEIEFNRKNGEKDPKEFNLEFPYRYLFEYLTERGLSHLTKFVRWRGNEPDTYPKRTKHFINALKVRLEFVFPYQYTRLQRNEAHVRLMSSVWYAMKALAPMSCIGFILATFLIVLTQMQVQTFWPIENIFILASPFLTGILALIVTREIELFLHYQRIREIIFILEAAYFAEKRYPGMFDPFFIEPKKTLAENEA